MKVTTFITLAAHAFPAVSAICCHAELKNPVPFLPGWCADTKKGTPCCATGKCNFFCCNCEGKCRTRNDERLAAAAAAAADDDFQEWNDLGADEFALADIAEHGNLTFEEYARHMGLPEEPAQMWIDWFHKHDRNGDGVITADEVDTV